MILLSPNSRLREQQSDREVRLKYLARKFRRTFFGLSAYVVLPRSTSGDMAMVMRAESMDLRKLAEVNGGGLPQNKKRKYASEIASVMR